MKKPLVLLVLLAPLPGAAQKSLQPEFRVDVLASNASALHASVGGNFPVGMYVRLGAAAGGGMRKIGEDWRASGRVDATARFLVDPFGEFKYGLYVGGGVSALFDERTSGRARAVVVAGFDGPLRFGRWMPGFEIGLGGGTRIGFTLRRARAAAR